MDYTHLGRSGVSVSRLCLGTMNFGAITDAAAAHEIMDSALEHGINFLLPACQGYGLGVLPWSPLHGGLLGGVLRRDKGGRSTGGRAAEALAVPEVRTQIETYEAFCGQLGEDPADVALAWLLHQGAVTAPIVGPRTAGQLDGALRALEITLDETSLAALNEIFPGPGGAAPEAYAW
jgi:NDP-hexose 2,3-enoyl reductase